MSAIESGVADRGLVMKTLLRSGLTIAALAAAPAIAAASAAIVKDRTSVV